MKILFKNINLSALSLGIREKIVGMWLIIVIVMGIWFAWQSEYLTHRVMVNDLQANGILLARNVAAYCAEAISVQNFHTLPQILADTMENNTDLAYIYLFDSEKNIIHHTHATDCPPLELPDFPTISTENCFNTKTFKINSNRIHDIIVPISNFGWVRLGITEISLGKQLSQTRRTVALTILGIVTLGCLATILYTNKLLQPLQELIAATRSLTAGDFSVRVAVRSQDEIGQLAASFNSMAEKLDSYKLINIKNQTELARTEKMRIELVKHLITAQEEERKRIARELHDETSQSLTALKLGLKTIEEATSISEIKNISKDLRQMLGATLAEITSISRNLRPSVLDDMGLHAALVRFIEETSKRIEQKIVFKSEGLNIHRFPFYIETAVYRIIQEAVTNSIKHAGATNIFISVNYDGNNLIGIIHDNGVGFKPDLVLDGSEPQKGLGLFGMQERAAFIGGSLTIDSDLGQGTTITVTVPNVKQV
ncbi:MAG: HAMP domain-containing protein [Firmicutes bacterium]|nr:HAMP domain-containing protein [Bacillota bacterium]